MLSSNNWRTTRQRVAPIAMRTAISRARRVDGTSSRLATFAQAISSTKLTAPIITRNIDPPVAADKPFPERLEVGTGVSLWFAPGTAMQRWAMPFIPPCALAATCRRSSRPKVGAATRVPRIWASVGTNGRQRSLVSRKLHALRA